MREKEDPSGTAAAWLDPREGSGNPTGWRPGALPSRETAGAPAARPSRLCRPRVGTADGRGLAGRIGGYWACPVASRGPRSAWREDEEHVMPPSPRSVRVPGPGLLPSPRSVRVPVPGMDRAAALATGGPAPASGGEVVDEVRDVDVAAAAKPALPYPLRAWLQRCKRGRRSMADLKREEPAQGDGCFSGGSMARANGDRYPLCSSPT